GSRTRRSQRSCWSPCRPPRAPFVVADSDAVQVGAVGVGPDFLVGVAVAAAAGDLLAVGRGEHGADGVLRPDPAPVTHWPASGLQLAWVVKPQSKSKPASGSRHTVHVPRGVSATCATCATGLVRGMDEVAGSTSVVLPATGAPSLTCE